MDDNKITVADDANEVDDTVASVSAVSVTAAADITEDADTRDGRTQRLPRRASSQLKTEVIT
jgi:succinylarginine dihydrolase